ncbi:methyl-accepting chemotaxis protein [Tumidithrix elongata RA019]|uniref:Methyl-accepting chemotaxis protein n=1 Tax=Tumidithrix elongata BACA0141 TaxID=2716417 RepID=A0AAW9PSA0_9CYAN|nr:methyl-accepting chemotaxis protein [Tumidithrix elongata RA019]
MMTQFQEAIQAIKEERYVEAMRQFSQLLYEDPRNPKLYIWLGIIYRKAGKIEYAKFQYQQVLTLTHDRDLLEMAKNSLSKIQQLSSDKPTSQQAKQVTVAKSLQSEPQNSEVAMLVDMGTANNPKLNGQKVNTMTTSSESVTKNANSAPVDVGLNTQVLQVPPPMPPLMKQPLKSNSPTPNLFKPDQPVKADQNQQVKSKQSGQTDPSKSAQTKSSQGNTKSPSATSSDPTGKNKVIANQTDRNGVSKPVIAEGMAEPAEMLTSNPKFSSIKPKITAWAIALATIPAIAIGISTYQTGSSNFVAQVKQTKAVEATSLADTLSRFMLKQVENVSLLGTLFAAKEVNKTPPAPSLTPAQQKQATKDALTNRLNLYKQAYMSFDSIAIFDLTGNLLAQSADTPTPHTLDKDFLKQVLVANSLQISKPALADQEYAINFAIPIKDPATQKVSTVLQARMPVKILLENLRGTGTSNFSVVDATGKYVVSTESARTGTDATADFANLADLRAGNQPKETITSDRSSRFLAYAPVPKLAATDLDWDVLTSTDKNAVLTANQLLLLVAAIGIGLTPLLVGAIAYALSNQLSSRLKNINGAVLQIAKGKLRTRLIVDGNDELAELSLSINKMTEEFQTILKTQHKDNERLQQQVLRLFKTLMKLAQVDEANLAISDESISSIVNKAQSHMARKETEIVQYRQEKELFHKQLMQMVAEVKDLSQGDLTVSAHLAEGDMAEVSTFFNGVIDNLRQIVVQVKTAAAQVNQSLGHNQHAITQLSGEAIKQAEQISRTLNSVQLMNMSVQTVVRESNQATELTNHASSRIQVGSQAIDLTMQGILNLRSTVTATAKKVKRLGESSQQIAKVVSLINDIAVQTNFLSINASLEAARAGEHGKGFALVAEEVGTLAARSAAAIKEVEQLIGNIQVETSEVMNAMELGASQVTEGTQLVEDAQKSLQQITAVSHQIDELVSSISDATGSQALTSECIANLMKDISQVSGRTASSSTKVSKSLQSSVKLAEQLQKSVDKFKVS